MRVFINICHRLFFTASLSVLAFAIYICTAPLSHADELTSALNLKMKYLSQNQAVISKNLANSNTPKYKALELKEPKYNAATSKGLTLTTTSPMHISSISSGVGGNFKLAKQKDTYETAPNGNNVSVEEQMVKMSANNAEHQTATNVLKKVNGLMNIARGGN